MLHFGTLRWYRRGRLSEGRMTRTLWWRGGVHGMKRGVLANVSIGHGRVGTSGVLMGR